jgi:transcriptional regulator with GAF, ATPase, and Fis domain
MTDINNTTLDTGSTGSSDDRVSRAFVELADTLVDDFDTMEFLGMLAERCVDLLEVAAAGVILVDSRGNLRVAAASSERAELLELLAIQSQDGPCIECVHDGQAVSSPDLTRETARWPVFAEAARAAGFRTAHALPLRLRRQIVGVLTLMGHSPGEIGADSIRLGQALADVATIGIIQQRTIERGAILSEQLQTALNSRVILEQAKGVLSELGGNLPMNEAFELLRRYARAHGRPLTELARAIVERVTDGNAILDYSDSATK